MLMKIFKLILLSFFLITSANSNSIYNLIKIPNLEIYELKTTNKLKYFYATKPFRLGIQKNISCFNSEKEKLIPELIDFVKKIGGQVSGKHGIGLLKKEYTEQVDKKIIENIKKRTDPQNKFNQGKIIWKYQSKIK